MLPRSFEHAAALDRALGDPRDVANPFSYAACADADADDRFPTSACAVLDELGVAQHYVPVEHGGCLSDYEQIVALMRMVARRDLTVAIAHGKTYLGAVSAWVGGTSEQAARVASVVQAGTPVSWALTERDHGSDLLAGEVVADRMDDGWALHGEKWLVNNATRGGAACVLARTSPRGGPLGFSIFFVDKRNLAPGSLSPVPKVLTHGIRGADISGLRFDGAVVGADCLVGRRGAGLGYVLKGLQLTRTLCCSLSIGAGDHGLAYATQRVTEGGARILDEPEDRQVLATAFADHLLAEAVLTVGARAIHLAPEELPVLAAALKYLLPTRTERMLARLRGLLGTVGQLGPPDDGGLAKLERDHRVVSLFDGNTIVNLNSLINAFPALVRAHAATGTDVDTERRRSAAVSCADLARPLPPVDYGRLSLSPPSGLGLLHDLPRAVAQLRRIAAVRPALVPAAAASEQLLKGLSDVIGAMRVVRPVVTNASTAAFRTAERLSVIIAGCASMRFWLQNQARLADAPGLAGKLWADGVWLNLALDRVLHALGGTGPASGASLDVAVDVLCRQVRDGHLPSLFDVPLVEAFDGSDRSGGAGRSLRGSLRSCEPALGRGSRDG